jgi:glycerol-3-phosphate acyltransferase PlsY
MGQNGQFILLAIASYLLGSIPFGKIAGNFYGVDIQKKGSGNIGFANVRRVLGWKAGLAVLAGDILKGFIPVVIAAHYLSVNQTMIVAALALIGHLFPVWLKFKGGKGVATTIGIALAISPPAGLLAALVYLLSTAIFRISAPSSLIAVWCLPLFMLIFDSRYFWLFIVIALIIVWTHRTNIRQMRQGM